MGVIAGGIARVSVDAAERKKIMFEVRSFLFCRVVLPVPTLYATQPDVFFFLLMPPIIFEAGYTLKRVCTSSHGIFFSLYKLVLLFAAACNVLRRNASFKTSCK